MAGKEFRDPYGILENIDGTLPPGIPPAMAYSCIPYGLHVGAISSWVTIQPSSTEQRQECLHQMYQQHLNKSLAVFSRHVAIQRTHIWLLCIFLDSRLCPSDVGRSTAVPASSALLGRLKMARGYGVEAREVFWNPENYVSGSACCITTPD